MVVLVVMVILVVMVVLVLMYRLTSSNGNCSCTGSDGSTID